MLADLIAATTPPAAPSPHDAYEWWSDIWLPAIVGIGSIAVAGSAVFVAMRSNRFARAATKAAERSNALARQALAHEREQAEETRVRLERERRAEFGDRFLRLFDTYVDDLEEVKPETRRSLADISSLDMETVPKGWGGLSLNEYAQWALDVPPGKHDVRMGALRDVRNAVHAIIAAWVRDPATRAETERNFLQWLRER